MDRRNGMDRIERLLSRLHRSAWALGLMCPLNSAVWWPQLASTWTDPPASDNAGGAR
jgi:hypothetical protein